MKKSNNMWTLKLIVGALVCSGIWASLDHFGGHLSRALGWENLPINLVIGGEIFLWAGAVWLFKIIDDVEALLGALFATLVFFGPHFVASWDFTTSLATYNHQVSVATGWCVMISLVAAAAYDVFQPVLARALASRDIP